MRAKQYDFIVMMAPLPFGMSLKTKQKPQEFT